MCTVGVWSNSGLGVLTGRNMDWLDTGMNSNLWVFPRGMQRVGLIKPGENSFNWTSKYGSVVTAAYDIASSDGLNEKSLAMHMLWLAGSDYGPRDQSIPGMAVSLWGQFFLDNFATVQEAVDYMQQHPLQLLPVVVSSYRLTATIHMLIEDATGDVAIFEYVNGKLNIHHDKNYNVMTNEPTFDEQLENLKKYQSLGGNQPLPGTTSPADRFVRTSYYLKQLQKPKNTLMAIASLLSVLRNAAQPFGAVDPNEPHTAATIWRTIIDHQSMGYYFESTTSPFMIWVDVNKLNFNEGTPVLKLDLQGEPPLMGDVTEKFVATEPFIWLMPEE